MKEKLLRLAFNEDKVQNKLFILTTILVWVLYGLTGCEFLFALVGIMVFGIAFVYEIKEIGIPKIKKNGIIKILVSTWTDWFIVLGLIFDFINKYYMTISSDIINCIITAIVGIIAMCVVAFELKHIFYKKL